MGAKAQTARPPLLLTPGPLTTTSAVKRAMLRDSCTWDRDYNEVVQEVRQNLVELASPSSGYTSVLMQGSGTFCIESVIGTALPRDGKLLVLANGAYGDRIRLIGERLGIDTVCIDYGEAAPVDPGRLVEILRRDPAVTHVAVVHTETTTGMLNPIAEVGQVVKEYGKSLIVDAMSSFGGIPLNMAELGIDYLISSANKCIQGVPGFGFVVAREEALAGCDGQARSLSLDLYDQWRTMEKQAGKWRYTSPTHTVLAFRQALTELEEEGGVERRHARYVENQRRLVEGLKAVFEPLLHQAWQSPIITSFLYPRSPSFSFEEFYRRLKNAGYIIYPGKITNADTFRIGSIGDVHPGDIDRLTAAVKANRFW